MFDPFVPLRLVRPELPVELCSAIDRCLEKEPTQRHASVGHLALELLPFAPARARASIERVVRTVKMGQNTASVLLPVTRRNESAFVRGAKVVTGILPTSRLVSVSWVALGIAIWVLVLRSGRANTAEPTLVPSTATSSGAAVPRSAVNSQSASSVPGSGSASSSREVSSTPLAVTEAHVETPKVPARVSSEPPILERKPEALTTPTRKPKAQVKSKDRRDTPPGRPLPVSPDEPSSSLDQDLDDPAYSNRK
jgi:hypothetical protein